MRYGYFDDENREYVITTPRTPLPWINYLGSEDFFSLVSNTAGGYSFYRDAKLLRLTRYRYNSAPGGRRGPPVLYPRRRLRMEPGWAARGARNWIPIAAATGWAIRSSRVRKTA